MDTYFKLQKKFILPHAYKIQLTSSSDIFIYFSDIVHVFSGIVCVFNEFVFHCGNVYIFTLTSLFCVCVRVLGVGVLYGLLIRDFCNGVFCDGSLSSLSELTSFSSLALSAFIIYEKNYSQISVGTYLFVLI